MRVPVPEVLLPYLERLGAGTDGKVWLPVMRETSQDRRIVTSRVNRGIRSWCKAHGIEPFTTYALRKSWATMARATGADKSLVDECIGHIGDYRMTDIYATRPWEVMADLNRKVLAMLEW
jgi:integrase